MICWDFLGEGEVLKSLEGTIMTAVLKLVQKCKRFMAFGKMW